MPRHAWNRNNLKISKQNAFLPHNKTLPIHYETDLMVYDFCWPHTLLLFYYQLYYATSLLLFINASGEGNLAIFSSLKRLITALRNCISLAEHTSTTTTKWAELIVCHTHCNAPLKQGGNSSVCHSFTDLPTISVQNVWWGFQNIRDGGAQFHSPSVCECENVGKNH